MSSKKVVIIGAGIAGITAAVKLIHNGVKNVTILEAQEYIGGRIKGLSIGGKTFDLGAQFIHGEENNPLFEIAKQAGLITEYESSEEGNDDIIEERAIFFSRDGRKIAHKDFRDLTKALHGSDQIEGIDVDYGKSDGDQLEQNFKKFLDRHQGELSGQEKEDTDAIYRLYYELQCIDNAVEDLHQVSNWASNSYVEFKGDRYCCVNGGMIGLLKTLADLIPDAVIQTNCPVTKIDWGSNSNEGSIQIACQNGVVLEADYVIVTISAACLHHHHGTLFSPPLPSDFTKALNRVDMGAIGKIYVELERPFVADFDVDISEGESSDVDDDEDDSVPTFFLWNEPHQITLESDRSKKRTLDGKLWWEGLIGFDKVYPEKNIAEFWLKGNQSEAVEDLDDQEIMNVLHELTSIFLKGYDIPRPVRIHKTHWKSNPFTRGTYSHPTPLFQKSDTEHWGKPLPSVDNPRVLFAGEAYILEYMSAAHGAYISGERQADLILAANSLTCRNKIVDLVGLV